MHSHAKKVIISCLVLLICGGCSKNTGPEPVVTAEYYPACHEPLAYLKNRTRGVPGGIGAGIAQGGVISGLASVIAGAITGNLSGVGVLAGTAAGGAVGGLVSGVNQHQNLDREDSRHLAQYLEQIDGDITGLDIRTAAATASLQCYDKEYQNLLAALRDGSMDNQTARLRLAEILAGRKEDALILQIPDDNPALQKEFNSVAH